MRISDWSSDVCSSDLEVHAVELQLAHQEVQAGFLELADERCPGGGQLAGRDAVVVGRAGAAVGLVQIGQAQQLPDDVIQLLVDRKSVVSGKSGSVRVDLGGLSIIKKKNNTTHT